MLEVQRCALPIRSEEHTSELQSHDNLGCRLLLEKKIHVTGPMTPDNTVAHTDPARGCARVCVVRGVSVAGVVVCALRWLPRALVVFFFKDGAPPEIYPLPLPAALPI